MKDRRNREEMATLAGMLLILLIAIIFVVAWLFGDMLAN